MKKVILLGLMLVSSLGFSQEIEIIEEKNSDGEIILNQTHSDSQFGEEEYDENHIYNSVQIMPEYPNGGINGFMQFISKNYDTSKISHNVKGPVLIQFVVEKDGSLSSFKILRDVGYGTGREAIRVLKKAKKWTPGSYKGKPVRVVYNLPIFLDIEQTKYPRKR